MALRCSSLATGKATVWVDKWQYEFNLPDTIPDFANTNRLVFGARAAPMLKTFTHNFTGAIDDITIRRGTYSKGDVKGFYEAKRDEVVGLTEEQQQTALELQAYLDDQLPVGLFSDQESSTNKEFSTSRELQWACFDPPKT